MAIQLLALAAGSALKGLAGIGAGYMQGKAAASQALGAQIERDMAKLRGTQIAERSREDLLGMLGNIEAIQTGRGVSLDSPTSRAIERQTVQDAYRAEAVARLSEMNRAAAAEQARRGYRTQARWALPLAVLNSAGDFAQAASYGSMGA